MADLCFAGLGPVVNRAVDDQAAPDPAPQCDIENRVKSCATPAMRFAKGSHVRVVINLHRQPRNPLQPLSQIELRPPPDLVRAANLPRAPVHRTAKAHRQALGLRLFQNVGHRSLNLLTNPGATLNSVDLVAVPMPDLSRRRAGHYLQLRPANLNPDKHVVHKQVNLEGPDLAVEAKMRGHTVPPKW